MQDNVILNAKQLEAVNIIDGPVMVFAGAGTGKTRTLTHRIAHMVQEGIEAQRILAITFTNKATNEMKERLYKLIPEDARHLTISTFHSLCARILRQDIDSLGYDKHFDILDEEDQLKVVSDAIKNCNIDKKKYTAKHIRNVINDCKCFSLKPDFKEEEMAFNEYERLMKEENCLDFEDLLLKTYELLSKHDDILEKYRYKYRYVLVDEFQDTSLVQYKIAYLLTQESRNLFVVGDDDQSIYSFRGTNYGNVKLFKKDFPEFKSVVLDENYRSSQEILKGANNIIKNNTDREKKELYSNIKGETTDVVINQAWDDREEVNYVVSKINELHRQGIPYNEMAILYRTSVISRIFELKLVQEGLPYKIYGGISYLRRREIKDIIAYLKFIINHNDINSFKRIINVPTRGIGDKTIDKLNEYRKDNKCDLFEAIKALQKSLGSKYLILEKFMDDINDLSNKLDEMMLGDYYEYFLEKVNFLESIKDDEDEKDRKDNIKEFKSVLVSIEDNGEINTRREKLIASFDEAILSDDKLQSQKQSADGITLSTVHSVKGLEYDTVFIVAFEEGIFPSLSHIEDLDMEEERRITYVAVTRAKKHLILTCAKRRMIYGSVRSNKQSQFLLEFIGKDDSYKIEQNKKTYNDYNLSSYYSTYKKKDKYDFDFDQRNGYDDDVSIEDFEDSYMKTNPKVGASVATDVEVVEKPTYKVGDTVNHKVYGNGIVVSLENKNGTLMGKICFTQAGSIKTFDMNHPSITKIK